MGLCGDTTSPMREEERRPTDVVWLIFFFLFLALLIFIAAFALVYGDPLRLVNGYDSFGNVCGSSNADMADHNDSRMSLSGYDTTDRRYVFFFDVQDLSGSTKVCVKECPDQTLHTFQDIQDFYLRTGSQLCRHIGILNYEV